MRKFAVILALSLLPAAAFAQSSPPQGAPPGGMRGQGRMQSTVEWLLTQKEQFRPSTEQVTKLEQIAAKLKTEQQEERDKMQKMREEMQNGGTMDRDEMREHFRENMEKLRKKDSEATEQALKVLNDDQQKIVKDLIETRRKEMEARRRPGM